MKKSTEEKIISVEQVNRVMQHFLSDATNIENLADLGPSVEIEEAVVENISATHDGPSVIKVVGKGYVDVNLVFGGGNARDGMESGTSFPITFSASFNDDDEKELITAHARANVDSYTEPEDDNSQDRNQLPALSYASRVQPPRNKPRNHSEASRIALLVEPQSRPLRGEPVPSAARLSFRHSTV